MQIERQIAQHRARIRMMQRDALFSGVLLAVLLALSISAFVLNWHGLIKVLLALPTLGMLMHASAPYTRMREHRHKLQALEEQQHKPRE